MRNSKFTGPQTVVMLLVAEARVPLSASMGLLL